MTTAETTSDVFAETTDLEVSPPSLLLRKLRGMAGWEAGWSFGEGLPVNQAAIEAAEKIVQFALQLQVKADVFPNLDGGCAVALYQDDKKFEVNVAEDGTRYVLHAERGIGFPFEEILAPVDNLNWRQLAVRLLQLIEDTWKSSESSTFAYLTERCSVSATSSTRTPQDEQTPPLLRTIVGGSQSSMPLALAAA